jgi:hypothetical protein
MRKLSISGELVMAGRVRVLVRVRVRVKRCHQKFTMGMGK